MQTIQTRAIGQCPFGYVKSGKQFIPEASEQEIMSLVAYLKDEKGKSYGQIARDLTDQGIPTKLGGSWWPGTVKLIYTRYQLQRLEPVKSA